MSDLWADLTKPVLGLSPMDGVTDAAFRQIVKKYGQPDLIYTEFVNVESIARGGKPFLLQPLIYSQAERPIIAQIYGKTPEYFRQVAILLIYLGFDGIDINMGCPSKNVSHSGSGAGLIKTPELAQEIIAATKQGVTDFLNGTTIEDLPDIPTVIKKTVSAQAQKLIKLNQHPHLTSAGPIGNSIPVSVKTRLGYDQIITLDWIKTVLELKPAAIALHGRTLRQQYSGQANWEEIGVAAELCHQAATPILGNGDVTSRQDALTKVKTYGVDGVLLGRAAQGNPFVFTDHPEQADDAFLMAHIALEHAQLYEHIFGQLERYTFLPMRKHLAWYIKGVPNAAQIRSQLVKTNTASEVAAIFAESGLI